MPVAAPLPPDADDPGRVVTSAWADHELWSAVANHLSNSIKRWRARAAAAGVAGLFCSLMATTMGAYPAGQKLVATLGVLLLALVPVLQQRLLSADRVLAWTRSRQVSEQLQSAIYRHLMGTLPPMPLDDGSQAPDPTGPGNLVRHCRVIKREAADLALLAATATPQAKTHKTELTIQDYLDDRLDNQITWYRKKALALGQEAQRLQQLEFALGLLSVVLSALVGNLLPAAATPAALESSPLGPWLALIASTGAAITAHIAGTRNLEVAAKYFATQDLLRTLRDEWWVDPERDTPQRVKRLVVDAEAVMAAEHGGWVKGWAQAARQVQGRQGQASDGGAEAPAAAAEPAPSGPAPAAAALVGGTAAAAVAAAVAATPDSAPAALTEEGGTSADPSADAPSEVAADGANGGADGADGADAAEPGVGDAGAAADAPGGRPAKD